MACLRPCPTCSRHIRSDESSCPFCTSSLPESFAVCRPTHRAVATSRAAVVLLGAVVACGKEDGPGGGAATRATPPYSVAPVDVRVEAPGPAASTTPLPDAGAKPKPPER